MAQGLTHLTGLPVNYKAQSKESHLDTKPIRFRYAEEACGFRKSRIRTEPALPMPTTTTPNFLSG